MILLEVAVNLFTRTWFRIRSVTSARQACRKIAVLSLNRSQRQLACEGLYCVTSRHVFNPRDVIMLNNRISVATITYARASPCAVPLNGMFHKDSATQCNKLRISNFVVSTLLDKRHLNSVRTQNVCDKTEDARVCTKWQWNVLDWCYWIALPAHTRAFYSENARGCAKWQWDARDCVTGLHDRRSRECNPVTPVECGQTEFRWLLVNEFNTKKLLVVTYFSNSQFFLLRCWVLVKHAI